MPTVKQVSLPPRGAFNGVKVFSASMVADRQTLGEKATRWLDEHPSYGIVDIVVTQSSDASFHMIAITIFFNEG